MNYHQESKKKQGRDKISRRSFLKYTGTIIFVAAGGCYVPQDKGAGNLVKLDESPGGIAPSQGYLLVDVRKCQGFTSCMLACTLVHEGVENPSLSRIQIIQNPFDEFKTRFYQLQGWDTDSGYPTRGTLESLGLGYVADELQKMIGWGKGRFGMGGN